MSKIISIDTLKNTNSNKISESTYLSKVNNVYMLIDEDKKEDALELSQKLFEEYGYIDKICEVFVMSIILNGDHLSDEDVEKYYLLLKKIYNELSDNELIASYTGSFLLPKYTVIQLIEKDDFDINTFFKKIYDTFPNNENIVYHYSASLLLNLDAFYKADDTNKKVIFNKTIELYADLIISAQEFENTVAVEFAKFIYLASIRCNDNEYILKKSFEMLKDLYSDFKDEEEVVVYYCLYISKNFIVDCSISSLKAINEFKNIVEDNNSFVFKEIFFLSMNNFISNQKLEDCKFAVAYMRNILYSLEDSGKKSEFIDIFAEMLSNLSCEQNIDAKAINDYILPLISNLIKDFEYTDNIVNEYCIILYNLSCLLNFYDDEDKDSPYLDVIDELLNCANHFDNAIPYYCLSMSNLIHLKDESFGYEVINTIKKFLLQFKEDNIPHTKNGISLKSIYIMAITNLINEVDYTKCNDLLLEINSFVDKSNKSLYLDLSKEYNEEKINIIFQYLVALSYYVSKLEISNELEALEYRILLKQLDDFLSEQEI